MSDDWTIRRIKQMEVERDMETFIDNLLRSAIQIPLSSYVFDSDDFRGLPTWNKPECDCGAKHTSFPKHHYHWCSVKANK